MLKPVWSPKWQYLCIHVPLPVFLFCFIAGFLIKCIGVVGGDTLWPQTLSSLTAQEIANHFKNKIDAISEDISTQLSIPLNIPCTEPHTFLFWSCYYRKGCQTFLRGLPYYLSTEPCSLTTTTVTLFLYPMLPNSHYLQSFLLYWRLPIPSKA